eukprot:scaffold93731_cov78-Phaeocystis_antarctica.AAC.10
MSWTCVRVAPSASSWVCSAETSSCASERRVEPPPLPASATFMLSPAAAQARAVSAANFGLPKTNMLAARRLLASPALRLGGGIARMQCTEASRALRIAGHAVTEPTERLQPRKGERKDSIDERTLHDRAMHDLRMQRAPVDADIYKEIQRLSLGRFKGWHSQRLVNARRVRAAKLLASAPAVLGRRGVLVDYDELSALNREALPELKPMRCSPHPPLRPRPNPKPKSNPNPNPVLDLARQVGAAQRSGCRATQEEQAGGGAFTRGLDRAPELCARRQGGARPWAGRGDARGHARVRLLRGRHVAAQALPSTARPALPSADRSVHEGVTTPDGERAAHR